MLLYKYLISQVSQMFSSAITALAYLMISSPFFLKRTSRLNKTSPKALSCIFKLFIFRLAMLLIALTSGVTEAG